MRNTQNRFMSGRDLLLTPLLWLGTLLASALVAWGVHDRWDIGLFAAALVFYFTLVGVTLLVLKVLRSRFPLRDGVYSYVEHPRECYHWKLYNFLCITNLNLFYDKILLPIPFRKPFFRLMGARIGAGIVPISGQLLEPHLIELGANTHIGEDALLTPHAVTSANTVIIARIRVGEGAMIGARATLMPGVTVGEQAMVASMALVAPHTRIPPYEIWGGVPARRIGDIREQPATAGASEPAEDH